MVIKEAASYSLTDVHRHYFTGETSDSDNGFRTIPALLRAVAEWMDENTIQDPEFQGLTIAVQFPSESDFYYSATLHYQEEGK